MVFTHDEVFTNYRQKKQMTRLSDLSRYGHIANCLIRLCGGGGGQGLETGMVSIINYNLVDISAFLFCCY